MTDKEAQPNEDAAALIGAESAELQFTELSAAPVSEGLSAEVTEAAEAVEASAAIEATEVSAASEASDAVGTADAIETVGTAVWAQESLPGPVLAARRTELRWTLDEAAERLKLTPRQVSALESNDFAALPGMASVRGFVRAYAKALGLDPQPLLDMLSGEPNPALAPMVLRRPLPSNGFPGRRASPPPRRSSWRRKLVIATAFAGVLLAAGHQALRAGWLQLPSTDDLSAQLGLPSFSSLISWSADALPAPAADATSPEAVTTAEVSADAPKPATVAPAAPALQLKFSEDAWVEITTISGQRIVSQLMKAGSDESFEITEPSVLVIGNASAVDARLRGQPLNLRAVARDNVSKLSIK